MAADPPDVARTGNCRASGNLNNGVCSIIVRRKRKLAVQKIDFREVKPCYRNVEINLELGEVLQLNSEQGAVPAGVFGKPIIGNHVGPNLSLAHVGQAHGRDLIKADDFGSFDAAVTGNDAVSVID